MKTLKHLIIWFLVLFILKAGFTFWLGDNRSLDVDVPPKYKTAVQNIKVTLEQKDDDAAMLLISNLLNHLNNNSNQLKASLLEQQARIHASRYHFHYAINSLRQADKLDPNSSVYSKNIKRLQARIDSHQEERNLKTVYKDSRYSGIAKTLKHDVTIAYVYLDDGNWSKWSSKTRQKNNANLEQVTDWYHQQAQHYGISNLNIDVRYFYVKSPKGITKEWLRKPEFFHYAQGLIAQQLGYKSFKAFTNAMSDNNPYHHVALVFHSNNEARSFAMSCSNIRNNSCKSEYVILTVKLNNNPSSWVTTQVQSHEILHLFGADDLYNIKDAKNYAVTDVMNYYSKDLKYSTIDPITAWAIGWDSLPKTPFKIDLRKEYQWK